MGMNSLSEQGNCSTSLWAEENWSQPPSVISRHLDCFTSLYHKQYLCLKNGKKKKGF